MAIIKTIENNDHLNELTEEFDSKFGTTTYFAEMTLEEIWDNLYIPTHPDLRWWAYTIDEYTNEILTDRIRATFNNKTGTVTNKDPEISEGMIGKINSMYLMKKDILNGVEFRDPMCASIFTNGNRPVHPGGTRMNWGNHYTKPIKLLITSYVGKPDFVVKPYQDFDFDLEGKNFSFMIGNSIKDNGWASYRKAAFMEDITYKQIQNVHEDYYKFLRPNEIKETVTFELSRGLLGKVDRLHVNEMLLAEKRNGVWRLVLND